MLAILAPVVLAPGPLTRYAGLIAIGLGFSLAGDIFLMLRPERFLAGLVAFFLAHLAYIAAFAGAAVPAVDGLALVLVVLGALIYAFLRPGLGPLRIPVMGYVAAILTMVWTAVSAWQTLGGPAAGAAAAGALCFLVSDTSLGVARFRRRFPGAQAITLGTYYLGQWLIALSAGPVGRA
jgi:uncharacterized membrane protein YhhN